ncbi:hypothetical protein K0B04_02565 [Patescibacteria group bacterium]|nr:hypothetical protein [Patescibacteria group bacterium]
MPKNIKTLKKEKEVKKLKDITKEIDEEVEEEEEVLPEDVQEALGINKAEKAARIKEIDYISELENGLDGFDFDEKPSKSSFDDDFDSDMD